jgi:hypothetical protein
VGAPLPHIEAGVRFVALDHLVRSSVLGFRRFLTV